MTNVCLKFEKAWPNQTQVINRTRLHMTDGRTDQWTDSCKAIYSLFFEVGHNKRHNFEFGICCDILPTLSNQQSPFQNCLKTHNAEVTSVLLFMHIVFISVYLTIC